MQFESSRQMMGRRPVVLLCLTIALTLAYLNYSPSAIPSYRGLDSYNRGKIQNDYKHHPHSIMASVVYLVVVDYCALPTSHHQEDDGHAGTQMLRIGCVRLFKKKIYFYHQ